MVQYVPLCGGRTVPPNPRHLHKNCLLSPIKILLRFAFVFHAYYRCLLLLC